MSYGGGSSGGGGSDGSGGGGVGWGYCVGDIYIYIYGA